MGLFIIGIILIIIGWVLVIPVLLWIGVAFAIIGLVLMLIPGTPGRPTGGSRYRYWW